MTFLDVQIISKVGKYTASVNRKTTFSMFQTQLVQRCEPFIKKMQVNKSSRSFHLIPVTHSDPMAGGYQGIFWRYQKFLRILKDLYYLTCKTANVRIFKSGWKRQREIKMVPSLFLLSCEWLVLAKENLHKKDIGNCEIFES